MSELTRKHLEHFAFNPHAALTAEVAQMATELIAARARIAEWDEAYQRQKSSHREHRAQLRTRIAELEQQGHRLIEFPEQLAVLPFLAIIREVINPSPSGANYGAVWERRTSGWECIAGNAFRRTEPQLPALVLWQGADRV